MEYKLSFVDQLDVDYISHHGIKGQHWGVRRYQNPDGSLTPEGRERIISSHEQRGRAIGRVLGGISGYMAYENSDKIANKTTETVKRSTQKINNKMHEIEKPAVINKMANKVGDKNNFKKIRNKTSELTKQAGKNAKKLSNKAREIDEAIKDDPWTRYEMDNLSIGFGRRIGESIGGAAGRTIGRVSADVQSAYGRHVVRKNKRKTIRHSNMYVDVKPSFVDQLDVNYISHHGIKGQHWGVRRFEDASGHLTPAGKRRYDQSPVKAAANRSTTKRQQTLRKIGKVAAGAALAGAAGYALYKTGAADAAINAGRNALESKIGIKSEKKSSGDFDKKVISGNKKQTHEASDNIRKANRTLSYQRRKEEASEKRKQTIRDTISNASSNAAAKAKDAIRKKVMDGVDEDDPSTWFNLITNTKGIVNKANRYGRAVNNLRKGNKIDAAAEISEDIADLTGKIIQGTQDRIENVRSRRNRKSK